MSKISYVAKEPTSVKVYDSNKESFESFAKFDVKQSLSVSNVLNPNFDNVFLRKKGKNLQEVDVKYINKNLYEFKVTDIPKSVDITFGCELETCFNLICREEKDSLFFAFMSWKNKVIYHLRNNIIPYASKEFKFLYPYAYIYEGYHQEGGDFIDMSNGEVLSSDVKDVDVYKTLIFEPDGSIKCTDKVYSVSCEIVTPILNSIEELRILYENLISTSCNESNKSMGFHVNVAAVDRKNSKIVKLSDGMIGNLIINWLTHEKDNYETYRGKEGSTYAQSLYSLVNNQENVNEFIKRLNILNVNGKEIQSSDFYKSYGLYLMYLVEKINSDKFLSMTHHKRNNVIEFRVFNSSNDIKTLLQYTQNAIDIFRFSIESYIQNPKDIVNEIQKSNLLYMYHSKINDVVLPEEAYLYEYTTELEGANILFACTEIAKSWILKKFDIFGFSFAETKNEYYIFNQKYLFRYTSLLKKYIKDNILISSKIFTETENKEKYVYNAELIEYEEIYESETYKGYKLRLFNPRKISEEEFKAYAKEALNLI